MRGTENLEMEPDQPCEDNTNINMSDLDEQKMTKTEKAKVFLAARSTQHRGILILGVLLILAFLILFILTGVLFSYYKTIRKEMSQMNGQDFKEEILQMKGYNTNIEDGISQLKSNDKKIEEEISQLKDKNFENAISELKSNDKNIEDAISQLTSNNKKIEEDISQMKDKNIEDAILQLKSNDENIEEEITQLKMNNTNIEDGISQLKSNDKKIKEEISQLKDKNFENAISELKSNDKNIEDAISQLTSNNKKIEEEISQLKDKNIEEEITQLKMNNKNIEDAISQLMSNDKKIEEEFSQLKENITSSACDPCPKGWVLVASKCYYIQKTPETWERSREECATHQSLLLILNNNSELYSLMPFMEGNKYWIGLRRDIKDISRWLWVDGTPLTFSTWSAGEPNNSGSNEHCAEVIKKVQSWNDVSCSNKKSYICKAPSKC